MIRLRPEELDLNRFETLVGEGTDRLLAGDPAAASELLAEALGLWRGPPLAEFAYEPFAQTAIARLEELRLASVERRVEADLALGRHAQLLTELDGLVREHPLRERLRAHHMLALYRAGRSAEALDTSQSARQVLAEELGIDPGPALQQVQEAILRQDPALDHAALASGVSPAAAPAASAEVSAATPERSLLVAPLDEDSLDDLVALAEPLSKQPARQLIVASTLADAEELAESTRRLNELRTSLVGRGVTARTAAFVSTTPGEDIASIAVEQEVDLVLTDLAGTEAELADELAVLLTRPPGDVAMLVTGQGSPPDLSLERPVLVPFGGAEHDWAAAEIGAWLAAATGSALQLAGTAADEASGRRDASKLLASASFAIQRALSIQTEPLLVEPGPAGVAGVAENASVLVLGLSSSWSTVGLGEARAMLAVGSTATTLLVRKGLRPSGLAPANSLTRFAWSLAPGQ